MAERDATRKDINLLDTLEKLRVEKFPHIPREIMRDVLRLHADSSAQPVQLANEVDALIRKYAPETN